jgi:hypothetical protein
MVVQCNVDLLTTKLMVKSILMTKKQTNLKQYKYNRRLMSNVVNLEHRKHKKLKRVDLSPEYLQMENYTSKYITLLSCFNLFK